MRSPHNLLLVFGRFSNPPPPFGSLSGLGANRSSLFYVETSYRHLRSAHDTLRLGGGRGLPLKRVATFGRWSARSWLSLMMVLSSFTRRIVGFRLYLGWDGLLSCVVSGGGYIPWWLV